MPNYRSFYDSQWIYAFDLQGKDANVRISRVEQGKLHNPADNKEQRKPVVFFDGHTKGLVLCKTNAKAIASMFGPNTDSWIGKWLTLFPTTTKFGRDTVDAIRIRPTPPKMDGAK